MGFGAGYVIAPIGFYLNQLALLVGFGAGQGTIDVGMNAGSLAVGVTSFPLPVPKKRAGLSPLVAH